MQGDEITVTGHAWLTCCPTNTPVEHVRLYLVRGSILEETERVLLFDVAANEKGFVSTIFTVPYVKPGRYHLEACGGLTQGGSPCLPEGRFTVLPGPPSPTPTAAPRADEEETGWSFPIPALLAIASAAAVAHLVRRRATPN